MCVYEGAPVGGEEAAETLVRWSHCASSKIANPRAPSCHCGSGRVPGVNRMFGPSLSFKSRGIRSTHPGWGMTPRGRR